VSYSSKPIFVSIRKLLLLATVVLPVSFGSSVVYAGAAGLLTGGAQELEPLTLSVVEPLAKGPYELESGKYFRNIWIDEIVINDIEIRPLGVASFEFDDEGEMEISFIAIRPGTYTLRIPGTTGESQQAVFTIK